jgi:hypothetical protein
LVKISVQKAAFRDVPTFPVVAFEARTRLFLTFSPLYDVRILIVTTVAVRGTVCLATLEETLYFFGDRRYKWYPKNHGAICVRLVQLELFNGVQKARHHCSRRAYDPGLSSSWSMSIKDIVQSDVYRALERHIALPSGQRTYLSMNRR